MLTSLFAHAVLAFAPVPRMATPTIGGSLFPLRSHHAHAVRMMDGAISIGTPLPDVDVEIVPNDPEERGAPKRVNIKDALGDGKTVLLGMPGAFTPTCNDRHLPGYYTSSDKLKSLGVSKVAVVTMNDRFVNAKWQADMEECTGASGSSPVMLLSDPRGDLAESLGLIAYLGRALGVRTKRFALVIDDGIVKHVAVDEGIDNLDATSVESICEVIKQSQPFKPPELNGATIGGSLVAGVLLVLLLLELGTNL